MVIGSQKVSTHQPHRVASHTLVNNTETLLTLRSRILIHLFILRSKKSERRKMLTKRNLTISHLPSTCFTIENQ